VKHISLAFAVFLMLFVAWRHMQPEGILFYQGVALAVAVAVAQLVLMMGLVKSPWRPAMKDTLLAFLLIYSFVFTVPTTVDRAYSVSMLGQLERVPEGMTRPQIEHWFATHFQAQGGVEWRLREQIATGSVAEAQGRYTLTPLGRLLARSFSLLQTVFACRPVER
jgi:hypothetical protein